VREKKNIHWKYINLRQQKGKSLQASCVLDRVQETTFPILILEQDLTLSLFSNSPL